MGVEKGTDHPGEQDLQHIKVTGACPNCDGEVTTTRGDSEHVHHVCENCRDEWVERDPAGG